MPCTIENGSVAEPVIFAKEELQRALHLLHAPKMKIRLEAAEYETDGYTVDMNFPDGHGFIRGSNPRSVLFGVYRLMRELGFRWIRPGAAGEIVPHPPENWQYIRTWEQASTQFRAICIEGAISRENLLDMVDWMARHNLNTYYLQAPSAYAFLQRWYSHAGNPMLKPEELTRERADEITLELIAALRKRGLILDAFGHGPTCEILGIPFWGWDPVLHPVTEEMKPNFAQINGVRDLWHANPHYTQLCYGNPEIREKLAERMVEQVLEHPEAELVHFILSDHHHNFCECDLCRKKRPSDWYVAMLNRIDEKLTAIECKIRIGFAVYCDTIWPPLVERIRNPERFFMIVCPMTRSYSEPLHAHGAEDAIPEYLQNISPFPRNGKDYLGFYNAWRAVFPGQCMIFDYHYMWDTHKDYSALALPRVLHADVTALRKLGMSGFISCQNHRVFFPNGLGMEAMAAGLWDEHSDFESIAEEFFRSAYGTPYAAARAYFRAVEEFLPPRLLRGEGSEDEKLVAARRFANPGPAELIAQVRPAITEGITLTHSVQRESWEQLRLHTEQLQLVSAALEKLWSNSPEQAKPHITRLFNWARSHEMRLQGGFDVYEYLSVSIAAFAVDEKDFFDGTDESNNLGEI